MKSADIIKRLKAEGWVKVGGKGDHEKFKHPEKPEGLLRRIDDEAKIRHMSRSAFLAMSAQRELGA